MKRLYKSSTGWCFWRWTTVDSEYITRLHVVKTPWFAVCVHWINKPDPEPYLHDHPVTFFSLILRGGYAELRARDVDHGPFWGTWYEARVETHSWFNFISACDSHLITFVEPGTVTLCFMGPKTREWGFHTPTGWVFWKDYHAAKRAAGAA